MSLSPVSRATQISRIVFGLLVLATFFAFFAAQRLKHTDPLVYSVSFKRYISPNDDGLREKGRVRFRTKKTDRVTVEVINRTGDVVRVLADNEPMAAGPHTFYWNGRFRGVVRTNGSRRRGEPVPDGAYRVRVTLRNQGRSFVPDQFFVVDTVPPQITANVGAPHQRSILRGRAPVRTSFSGAGKGLRAEFLVYRVRGARTVGPVASFMSTRGTPTGAWDQTVGRYSRWRSQCQGIRRSGRARPAPVGSYVIVARACDAAGNVGSSSTSSPPRRGSTRGSSGVTLTGVQLAPPTMPAQTGRVITLNVSPPVGGYDWTIGTHDGTDVGVNAGSGSARGPKLTLRVPKLRSGLYELTIRARRPVAGDRGVARVPLPITTGRTSRLLIVEPAIAWQATNPVDTNGDGFGDPFETLPAGKREAVSLQRPLQRAAGPVGFYANEAALAHYIANNIPGLRAQYTTDIALARDPQAAFSGHNAVLFAGDQRWITAALGVELRKFVERGGKVAFFSPDAFRRTVTLTGTELVGPSEARARDVFGESVNAVREAPAPIVPFTDQLGLLRGPTGLFTSFEESERLAAGATILTSAGRSADAPALVGYRLGKGTVIRVGVDRWLAELARPNVGWTTNAIVEVLR